MSPVAFPVRVVLWKPGTPHFFDQYPMFSGAVAKISDALAPVPIPAHPLPGSLRPREEPRDLHETVRELLLKRLHLGEDGWEIKSVSPPDGGNVREALLRHARLARAAARQRRLQPHSTPQRREP